MIRWLAHRFPALLMARRNLSRARARSILAALGIVIGVVAIASLGMFGTAFERSQLQNFGEIGNDVVVYPGEDSEEGLTERDVRDIRRTAPGAEIVPIQQSNARVSTARHDSVVTVYGVGDPGQLYEVREGRIPGTWRKGVLVGADLADTLGLRVGSSVTVAGQNHRVVAILENEGQAAIARPNRAVVMPQEQVSGDTYQQVVVRADSTTEANQTATTIRQSMNDRRERVFVLDRGDIGEQIDQFFLQLNLFLIGIGGISLFVAGVSILNVMLMSVMERREEIGVLRAVGYQKRDVLRVLVAESAVLGVIGAAVGVALSMLVGLLINQLLLGDPLAFDARGLGYVLAALAFGLVTSVLGGLYPAWKAASQRPVEALRN